MQGPLHIVSDKGHSWVYGKILATLTEVGSRRCFQALVKTVASCYISTED